MRCDPSISLYIYFLSFVQMLQMIRGWLSRNGWAVGVFGDAKHDWIPFHWNGALCASMCDVCAYQLFSLVRRVSNQNQNNGNNTVKWQQRSRSKWRVESKKKKKTLTKTADDCHTSIIWMKQNKNIENQRRREPRESWTRSPHAVLDAFERLKTQFTSS